MEPVLPWDRSWIESQTVLEVVDGTVLKQTIDCGSGNRHGGVPTRGCVCDVDVVGWVEASKEIFLTSYERIDGRLVGGTGEPLQIHVGFGTSIMQNLLSAFHYSPADSGELPSCVQHLVQGMQVGEAALFWVESTAAFGKKGNGGKVPADADIILWLRLLGFSVPMPPTLPQAELEASEERRKQSERDAFLAHPPPSWEVRLSSSDAERLRGNALFQAQQYEDACKAYARGMVHLFMSTEEAQYAPASDTELRHIHSAKAVLLLNRCAAHKALCRWDSAQWDANESLKHALQADGKLSHITETVEPSSLPAMYRKALFRRGQCRLGRAQELAGSRPCVHLEECTRTALAAVADIEASQGARELTACLAVEEQGSLHVVPPPCGHERLLVGARVPSPPPLSQAAAAAVQQATALVRTCRMRLQEGKVQAMRQYGGSLLKSRKQMSPSMPPQGAAAAAADSDDVPELGD